MCVLDCASTEAFQQQPIASFVGHPSPWSNVCSGASLVVVTRWDPADERKSGNWMKLVFVQMIAEYCRCFFVCKFFLYLLVGFIKLRIIKGPTSGSWYAQGIWVHEHS